MEAISNRMLVNEIPQPETTTTSAPKNIAYRGGALERVPGEDEYAGKKKHTGLKAFLGILCAAAVALGITCFVKGKKAGADKLGDKMKEGWKEVWADVKKGWEKLKNKFKKDKADKPDKPKEIEPPKTEEAADAAKGKAEEAADAAKGKAEEAAQAAEGKAEEAADAAKNTEK